MPRENNKYFLLTIDVEDWFQVENFKPWIPFETWDQRELRVERNVHRLLDLFDSVELSQKKYPQNPVNPVGQDKKIIQATFFILGWIAVKLPHLVREINARGHEVASHGNNHDLPHMISLTKLQRDLTGSKKKLEDITGIPVYGYRTPSFAISDDILKTIQSSGYRYDSSYNSFSLHGRYGQISLNDSGKQGIAHELAENFYELPISNLPFPNLDTLVHFRLFKHFHLPWGGGAYFRLLPAPIFKLGIKAILKRQDDYLLYFHPWEIDPNQPKVEEASPNFKFRHYSNLSKTHQRLERLITSFSICRFITCRQYLNFEIER